MAAVPTLCAYGGFFQAGSCPPLQAEYLLVVRERKRPHADVKAKSRLRVWQPWESPLKTDGTERTDCLGMVEAALGQRCPLCAVS